MRIAGIGVAGLMGMGATDGLTLFAQTIQQVEGYYAPGQNPVYPNGTLAWINNNPGNLVYTSYYAQNFGAVPGQGSGGYAAFPDYNTGWAALLNQIQLDAGRGLTIGQMMAKYAPASSGNNPTAYAQTIANALGVTVDTPVALAIGNASGAAGGITNPILMDTTGGGIGGWLGDLGTNGGVVLAVLGVLLVLALD